MLLANSEYEEIEVQIRIIDEFVNRVNNRKDVNPRWIKRKNNWLEYKEYLIKKRDGQTQQSAIKCV